VLSFVASALHQRDVFVRDTHSEKAPRAPKHKMDACLVWSGSTSADVNLQVKWTDVICPIEIKPEINDDCVRQLCDTASEIFVQQSPRELVYGLGLSSREVQLFRFSLSEDGEPHLSWNHSMPLFRDELDLQAPTSGFHFLVELLSQKANSLGFLPRGADSEFLKFFKQNAHVRRYFDVDLLQTTARKSLKPELLSLKFKGGASSSSSSASSSSSSADWAAIQQMNEPVKLENHVLELVCIAIFSFILRPLIGYLEFELILFCQESISYFSSRTVLSRYSHRSRNSIESCKFTREFANCSRKSKYTCPALSIHSNWLSRPSAPRFPYLLTLVPSWFGLSPTTHLPTCHTRTKTRFTWLTQHCVHFLLFIHCMCATRTCRARIF
jgi:hypothetical protein